jgi:hypothetical protein
MFQQRRQLTARRSIDRMKQMKTHPAGQMTLILLYLREAPT